MVRLRRKGGERIRMRGISENEGLKGEGGGYDAGSMLRQQNLSACTYKVPWSKPKPKPGY